MLITEAPGGAPERTWRPPLEARIAVALCLAVFTALPARWLALTLVTNQVADGGWIALGLGLAAWAFLAGRTLVQSVTLTADTVVIRNIFTTERVPLADVTDVSFRRGKLTVTSQHGTFAPERNAVEGVSLGPSRWSGRRTKADAIAETMAAAAELPPPPPREEITSRNRARFIGLAAFVLCGFGLFFGPPGSLRNHHRSFALVQVGAMLYVFGIGGISFASRLSRDHRRNRPRQPRR